ELERVAAATVFESYGNFDWYTDFPAHQTGDVASRIAAEPLIASEGRIPAGLLLVRSGFARVSHRYGHGEQTTAYLGKGQVFGLDELIEANQTGQEVPLRQSLRAVGYVDVLRIPIDTMFDVVLATVSSTHNDSQPRPPRESSQDPRVESPLTDLPKI